MQLIRPVWAAPEQIQVVSTTRIGGVSQAPYYSLNMGDHVGDRPAAVAKNRARLLSSLALPDAQWLTQVHGTACVEAQRDGVIREADACWTSETDLACVIMTADCLPAVFTDGERVAAAHAGWRGLVDGVLEATLAQFAGADMHVWLGPAIGPSVFEVGEEVRQQFCDHLAQSDDFFLPSVNQGKWLADLYGLARLRLSVAGIDRVSGGDYCTYSDKIRSDTAGLNKNHLDSARFFSYRREQQTGRMATLIWKTAR
ncbi:peptidoglycan editing factor PgeF [Neptunomonas antarctica]|nr:peptidoglycan editing factor PgeF [Neptunomonas antarctica]